jgi:hypothetical protein
VSSNINQVNNMAELAYALEEKILEKLGSLAYEEINLALHIKSELTELKRTMETIQAVLLDAEEKQATNRPLSIWLRQLKDVFSDIENVLDEVEYEVLKKQVMIRTYGRTSREVCRLFSCCSAFAFRSQLGHKIKDIREKLGKIAANRAQFNLTPRLEDRHVIHGRRRDMTHSFVPPSEVIGRDDDKENIIHLLMGPDADADINAINVIPIVGIGGLGKTTIAKLVYDDERVANHFNLRIWVCVSMDFDVPKLIGEILKELGVVIDERLSTLNTLQNNLRQKLNNKKFLLVLDDVWNEDRSKWIELKGLLSGGSVESRIVVTTRSRSVVSIVKTGPIYTLKGLSHDDCLSLFMKWAFVEGEDKQYPNLLKIGNEIVEKCKGVPLAIRTLGNLLFSKVDERKWKFVRDNGIWKLEQNESGILPALKLSYDQMSSHLKQCFAFCSLFPKDHLFDSGELIVFWMAHELLNKTPDSQILELEDVGDMYIKELLSKSFFQDVANATWYCRFKMHDLVHDLALKVAEEECLTVDLHTHNIAGTIHHLSFSHNAQQVPNYFDTLSSGVRTLLFRVEQQLPATLVEDCISRFKCLRVLDLTDSSFEVLSSSIGTLKHLRSLSLAGNRRIKKLPNSICELYNLQTLLLRGCESLERLPKDTRKLISLRYLTVTTTCESLFENDAYSLSSLRFLGIFGCERLEVLFQGMNGSLTNLRTLVVSDCKSLTSLIVKHRREVTHITFPPSACRPAHITFPALETLEIIGCKELFSLTKEVPMFWYFSNGLQKLKITNVPKLEVLLRRLQSSYNTLQYLHISLCQNLTTLPEWLTSQESLQTLEIFDCYKLTSLPEGMDRLTTLKELKILYCNELIQKCKEEDRSKIAHIPTVTLVRLHSLTFQHQSLILFVY